MYQKVTLFQTFHIAKVEFLYILTVWGHFTGNHFIVNHFTAIPINRHPISPLCQFTAKGHFTTKHF
jgi:hypothetical protein